MSILFKVLGWWTFGSILTCLILVGVIRWRDRLVARKAEADEREMYAELREVARVRAEQRRRKRAVNPVGDVVQVHIREQPAALAVDEYLRRIGHAVTSNHIPYDSRSGERRHV